MRVLAMTQFCLQKRQIQMDPRSTGAVDQWVSSCQLHAN